VSTCGLLSDASCIRAVGTDSLRHVPQPVNVRDWVLRWVFVLSTILSSTRAVDSAWFQEAGDLKEDSFCVWGGACLNEWKLRVKKSRKSVSPKKEGFNEQRGDNGASRRGTSHFAYPQHASLILGDICICTRILSTGIALLLACTLPAPSQDTRKHNLYVKSYLSCCPYYTILRHPPFAYTSRPDDCPCLLGRNP
jgi:hypothetical protein